MTHSPDKGIRWKQRFQNYGKAFARLESALAIANPNETERAGIIQFFELTFELAWKTLKDYLDAEGFTVKSPREAVKQAFQIGAISLGEDWLEALDDRNLTSHTYEDAMSREVEELIRSKFFPRLKEFHATFSAKLP